MSVKFRIASRWVCAFTLGLSISATVFADRTIIILRHAEKPELGLGQLSCEGLNRSLALAPMLLQRYGKPIAIYAPNPIIKKTDKGVEYAYVRPLATIEPLAIATSSPVILDFGMSDIQSLAKSILAQPSGTQYVVWEHHWAEALTRALLDKLATKSATVPKWLDSDFDSLYIIRVHDESGVAANISFTREHENLGELSKSCPIPTHAAP